MKQHITQEQAQVIADELYTQFQGKSLSGAFANAAIQHYINQQAKELPVLPDAKYIGDDFGYTEEHMKTYGAACAAHAREMALSDAKQACDDVLGENNISLAIEALKGK